MGARQKLNEAFVATSVIVAGLIAWAAGSWTVFFVALIFLLALNLIGGDIRLKGGR